MEIRAGTGGDESALFAGDLLRMYTRYADSQGWRVELVSESASELGGYKEVVVRFDGGSSGDGVYGWPGDTFTLDGQKFVITGLVRQRFESGRGRRMDMLVSTWHE